MNAPRPSSPARRRVSQRRYMVRRVGALVVVSALVGGGMKVGGALFGADDTSADSTSPVTTQLVTGDTSAASASSASVASEAPLVDGAGTTVVPADSSTTAAPAAARVPTAADPARVLIAGDSDAGTFGPYLEQLMGETGVATTTLDYKVSSGLARPDFFDWPAHFREAIPQQNPDIVVVTFGGNDSQGLTDGLAADGSPNFIVGEPNGDDTHDAEWRAEYGRRVGEVMDYLLQDGRSLVWVGIPNDDNPDVTLKLGVQDEVVRAEAAARPGVVFIDTWARFSGREGNWAQFIIDPRDGQGKDVRADDGFHLNTTGAEILALEIGDAVKQILRDRGAQF